MASRSINTILSLRDNMSSGLKGIAQNFRRLQREAQNSSRNMTKSLTSMAKGIDKVLSKAGKLAMGGLTAAVGGVIAPSITVGANFDQSMAKVKALSGATAEQFEQLRAKAKEMGMSTTKSAKESADALGYMALAGWDTEQMLTGLRPILKASEAGTMDLARCSDLVTDSMSALGVEVGGLENYLNIVTKAQAKSNTSMEQLLEAYVTAGGSLKELNVPLTESAAILGVMANQGLKGAEAGNSLNSILVNLIGASSSAAGAMAELGVSAWDENGNFIGLFETLKKLDGALSNCTQEQKNMFQAAIGGKTQLNTLQKMLAGVKGSYQDLNGELINSEGYLEAFAKEQQDSLSGDFSGFKSALESVGLAIYDKLAPSLREITQLATEKLQYITENFDEIWDKVTTKIKELMPQIKAAAATFATMFVVSKGIKGFLTIHENFTKMKNLATAMSGPLNNIKNKINTVSAAKFTAVNNQLKRMPGNIVKGFKNIPNTFKNVIGSIKKIPTTTKTTFSNCFASVKTLASTAKTSVANIPGLFKKNLVAPLKLVFSTFKQKGTIAGFKQILLTLKGPLMSVKGGLGMLGKAFMSLFSPVGLIIGAIALLVAGFLYLWNTNEEFRTKITEIWTSISETIGSIVGTILEFLGNIASWLYNFYKEHKAAIDGFIQGVITWIGDLFINISTIVGDIIGVFQGIIDFIVGVFTGNWEQAWNGIKNTFTGIIDTIKSAWQGLKDLLAKPIKAVVNFFKGGDAADAVGNNATGTRYYKGGVTWVGEHGPEMVNLPSGSKILTNSESQKVNGGNNINVNVNVAGNIIGNEDYANYIGSVISTKIQRALLNMA